MAAFVFATCLPGLERAVKLEVARTRPELRFSYSRPGLVTFKSERVVTPDDRPGSVFARVWGRSLGAARTPEAACEWLRRAGVSRVHVFRREPESTCDLSEWRAACNSIAPGGDALSGEVVGNVIVAEGEGAWVGVHRADDWHFAVPGGAIDAPVPVESPSRAFAKIEEALTWSGMPVAPGDVALELGSSPGGASLALAMRGVTVFGVDPAAMDPAVLAFAGPRGARVHHVQTKVSALRWESLPKRVDWLLSDMNLAPQVVLHELARLMPPLKGSLRGAVITLKLNNWDFVSELPALGRRLEELGLGEVRMRHLPSHRREVCAVAFRRPLR